MIHVNNYNIKGLHPYYEIEKLRRKKVTDEAGAFGLIYDIDEDMFYYETDDPDVSSPIPKLKYFVAASEAEAIEQSTADPKNLYLLFEE